MPLTIFSTKGIAATRREHIQAAVEAGGKHLSQPNEGWIAADPFQAGVRLLITKPAHDQPAQASTGSALCEDSSLI